MKKVLAFILVLLVSFSLVACKKNNDYNDLLAEYQAFLDRANQLLEEYENKNQDLKAELDEINNKLEQLEGKIDNLEYQLLVSSNFSQDSDLLSGSLTTYLPSKLGNYNFKDAKVIIRHPLMRVYELDDKISEFNVNSFSKINVDVNYHGIYEVTYQVNYELDNEIVTYEMNRPVAFTTNQLNVAWLHATMPTLLFAADLFTGKFDEGYTYVDLSRHNTYDFTKLPNKAMRLPGFLSYQQTIDSGTYVEFWDFVDIEKDGRVLHWIKEIYLAKPTIKINFALVDNILTPLNGMYSLGIPEGVFNLTIYTDGVYTTNWINGHILEESTLLYYENIFEVYRTTKIANPSSQVYMNYSAVLASSKYDHIEYVVNSKDGWLIKDSSILNNYNLREVSIKDAFTLVDSYGNLDKLEWLFKTRWGDGPNDSMYQIFEGEPSKNLLILGTSLAGEVNDNYATLEKYLEYIINEYGSEYKIFYKGHPAWPSSEDRKDFFSDNNITELVNTIPVETLMLLYDDVYVGGYAGTSFVSSLEDQTIFFFGTRVQIGNNNSLKPIIDENVIFKNTVYLTKDNNGEVIVD